MSAPQPGEYRLYVWLEDAAGNQREATAAVSVPLRFDPEPPELAFLPPDPADPLRVSVNATDRHSGLAQGEIEMRATGGSTWHGLPTELNGSQLVAYVDDERFRRGTYEFRARGVDQAGNETSTGAPHGRGGRDSPASGANRHATDGGRRCPYAEPGVGNRHGRHRPRRDRTRLDDDVAVRHRRVVDLRGRLVNLDGQPLEGATIEALERRADGVQLPVGLATTGADGRFRYRLRATQNRDARCSATGVHAGSAARQQLSGCAYAAASSIRVNRALVRNGQAVRFSGRVASRPLPADGKLLEMQAHFRGRWRTFSTLRTDRRGVWQFSYRFGATLGRVLYRFRVWLPREGGYPFIGGHSPVARVLVLGP